MVKKKIRKIRKPRKRISKDDYYLNIAREVAGRSTCTRRIYGAVIVNKDQIIATGYAGPPRGTANCSDLGACLRRELGIPRGQNYEICRGVHAEQNAIIHASRLEMLGGTLYLVGLESGSDIVDDKAEPCLICKRMIINSGIKRVVVLKPSRRKRAFLVKTWIKRNLNEFKKVGRKIVFNMPRFFK